MRAPAPRHVVHLELHTSDPERAASYYAALCGWRPEPVCTRFGTYVALDIGAGVGGGIVRCPAARPVWLPYVEVARVDEATELARDVGARVLLEPREGPAGWRSVVTAPGAGELAFWQPKR
jgi:predicted enzyme related to lactoylglutathione lyase